MAKSTNALNICTEGLVKFDGKQNFVAVPYKGITAFTPTISGSSDAGTANYVIQNGYYFQIGNLIHAQGKLKWTGHTGVGDLWITDLSMPSANLSNYYPECIINAESIPLPENVDRPVIATLMPNTTRMVVNVASNNSVNKAVQLSQEGCLQFTIVYSL